MIFVCIIWGVEVEFVEYWGLVGYWLGLFFVLFGVLSILYGGNYCDWRRI